MSELVEFLAQGKHPIELSRYQGAKELKECIERSYVLVKFTDTRGGTELGVRLDMSRCDLSKADFDSASGSVRLVGHLNLDFVDIECTADIEVTSLIGTGQVVTVSTAVSP